MWQREKFNTDIWQILMALQLTIAVCLQSVHFRSEKEV